MKLSPPALTLAAVLLASAFLAGGVAARQEDPQPPQGLRALLVERRNTLVQIEDLQRQRLGAGVAGAEDLIRAGIDRLRAELDLAASREERIELLEGQLEQSRAFEERAAALASSGRATEVEVLRARAFRLEAAIELERAR